MKQWEIIERQIDWLRIQRVMYALDWTYENNPDIPTIKAIKEVAKYVVSEAIKEKAMISSGGFTADVYGDDVVLFFVLEEGEYISDYDGFDIENN